MRGEQKVGGTPLALVQWTSRRWACESVHSTQEDQLSTGPGMWVLTGSHSERSAAVRREAARKSDAGIVQVVAASAVAVLALEEVVAEAEAAGVAAHMAVVSIGGWARVRIQIPEHRFEVFGVLYRRIAAAAADAAADVVAAVGGGNSGPFPAEIDGATARPRVTGGFHGSQSEVWL